MQLTITLSEITSHPKEITMKLYVMPVSPNVRKAQAVVNYLNLDIEVVSQDVMAGDLSTDEFLGINPNGKVPTLEDGEFKLWESNAIAQYLALTAPENDLFPDDLVKRTDITRWQFWESNHYNKAVGSIVWETLIKPLFKIPGGPDKSKIDAGLTDFNRFAPILEKQLNGNDFITGDTLTLADFSVGAMSALVLSKSSRVPLEDYPKIKSWYLRLEAIPEWAASGPPFEI